MKTLLVVAGLDPSGGAGLIADVRLASARGFYVTGVVTSITEQDSSECLASHPVHAQVVQAQLTRAIADQEPAAIKIGMLGSSAVAAVVARALAPLRDVVPIVFDPVLRATRGVALFDGEINSLDELVAIASLITPNVSELAALAGIDCGDLNSADALMVGARHLLAHGARAVLAKGGHLRGAPIDVLVSREGECRFAGSRWSSEAPHGTGCALSTEIACLLGQGRALPDAVQQARAALGIRIQSARRLGRGRSVLVH